jgi:hypothetical protein
VVSCIADVLSSKLALALKQDLVDVKEDLREAIGEATAVRQSSYFPRLMKWLLILLVPVGTQADHEIVHLDQEFHTITAWLSSLDFAAKQIDFFNRRQPGTGEWLLSDPRFKHWLEGKERILWCPGLRKTMAAPWCSSYLLMI